MKIDLDKTCCGKCLYYNGDMSDEQAFCDEREDFVSKGFYCYRYKEDETKKQKYLTSLEEEIRADERAKVIEEISLFIRKEIENLEERESSECNEGRWIDEEKCSFAIDRLEILAEQMKDENLLNGSLNTLTSMERSRRHGKDNV